MLKKLSVLFFMLLSIYQCAQAQLITYKAPEGSFLNTDFKVKVRKKGGEWQSLSIYLAKVARVIDTKSITENTSFSYFDFSGEVEISVTYNKGNLKTARIRPLSYDIASRINGNTITFSLKKPQNLSVEVNGDIFHNLQLFANPIETLKPLPTDTNVMYYAPGIHQIGKVKVPSNKTVYISGGAIVQGQLLIEKAENVRVLGHGILTQLPVRKQEVNSLNPDAAKPDIQGSRNDQLTINFSKNVEINGPVVMPNKYSVFIGQSADVKIRNIKSFSSGGNADGIDVFCSTDILIDGVYMRNSDDCVAIYGHRWSFYGNVKDVTVSNSTLWADVAHPILIGTHGDTEHPDTLGNMKFVNIDILDQHENQIDYQGCLALNAGDNNLINNIRFDHIRIEDIRKGQLVNFRVMFNHKYNTSAGQGIENIYLKNISYTGSHANLSVIAGYDESRRIKNIVFENLRINGKVITDNMADKPGFYKTGDMANILIGEHVGGIRFIPSKKDSEEQSNLK